MWRRARISGLGPADVLDAEKRHQGDGAACAAFWGLQGAIAGDLQRLQTHPSLKGNVSLPEPVTAPLPLQKTPAPTGRALAPAQGCLQQGTENHSSKKRREAGGEEQQVLSEAGPTSTKTVRIYKQEAGSAGWPPVHGGTGSGDAMGMPCRNTRLTGGAGEGGESPVHEFLLQTQV